MILGVARWRRAAGKAWPTAKEYRREAEGEEKDNGETAANAL
jgi:hypothetical protein